MAGGEKVPGLSFDDEMNLRQSALHPAHPAMTFLNGKLWERRQKVARAQDSTLKKAAI